jgi:hypothetical protein
LIELDLGPSGKTDSKPGGTTGTSYRLMGTASNTTAANPFFLPMTTTAVSTSNVTAASLLTTTSPTAVTTNVGYSGLSMLYNPMPTSTMPIYQGMYTYQIATTAPSTTSAASTPAISSPNRYPTTTTNPSMSFRN